MSGKIRQRTSANTERAMNPMNTNERILKVCIYINIIIINWNKYIILYFWYFWYMIAFLIYAGLSSVVHGS